MQLDSYGSDLTWGAEFGVSVWSGSFLQNQQGGRAIQRISLVLQTRYVERKGLGHAAVCLAAL